MSRLDEDSKWRSTSLLWPTAIALGVALSLLLLVSGIRKSADTLPYQQQGLLVEIQQLELSTLRNQPAAESAQTMLSILRLDIGNRLLLDGGLPGPLMPELTASLRPLLSNGRFATLNHTLNDLQEQLIAVQRTPSAIPPTLDSLADQFGEVYDELATELRAEELLAVQRAQEERIQMLVMSIVVLLGVVGLLFTRVSANSQGLPDQPIPAESELISDDVLEHAPTQGLIDLSTSTLGDQQMPAVVRTSFKSHQGDQLYPLVSLSDYHIHGLILPAWQSESVAQRILIAEEIWQSLERRQLSIPIIVGLNAHEIEQGLDLPPHPGTMQEIELGIAAPLSSSQLERALTHAKSGGWRTRVMGMTLQLSEALDFRRWTIEAAHIDPNLVQPPSPSADVAKIGRALSDIGIPIVADGLRDTSLISPLLRSGVSYGSGHALAEPVYVAEVVDWAKDTLRSF